MPPNNTFIQRTAQPINCNEVAMKSILRRLNLSPNAPPHKAIIIAGIPVNKPIAPIAREFLVIVNICNVTANIVK